MKKRLLEFRYILEYLAIWPIVTLARALSEGQAEGLVKVIARVAYAVLSRDRRWAYRNLELVFGNNLTPAQRREIVLGSFETIVRTRVQCLRWSQEWMLNNVVEEGGEATRAIGKANKEKGRGVIMITAHLGNFEILPAYCAYTGYPSTVMYRPQDNWRVEKLILGARHEYLPNVVRRSTTGLMTLGYVLREGGAAGLLIDMNTLENPVFVDFLGYQAASPPGAAALALSTQAEVVLAISIRQPNGKYRLIFHPPFETIRTGNKKADVIANTQQYMNAIEKYILAYPEQYNWPHPRWRFRPDETFWTLHDDVEKLVAERKGPAKRIEEDPTSIELLQTRLQPPARKAA